MTDPSNSLSLSANITIFSRIKEGYMIWMSMIPHIPKGSRYTIGARIENKFLDLLEVAYTAYFTEKGKKIEKISECILNLDIIKFLISIAWEARLVSNKHYAEISLKLDETGKILGGWRKSLENSQKNRIL